MEEWKIQSFVWTTPRNATVYLIVTMVPMKMIVQVLLYYFALLYTYTFLYQFFCSAYKPQYLIFTLNIKKNTLKNFSFFANICTKNLTRKDRDVKVGGSQSDKSSFLANEKFFQTSLPLLSVNEIYYFRDDFSNLEISKGLFNTYVYLIGIYSPLTFTETTPMMQTIQPGPLNRNRGSSRLVAGIVSGAIVGVVCIVFAILVYLKIRNSKINTSQIPNDKGAWPLTELRSSYSVSEDPAKSSVSTYISAVSNDLSFYDRNNVTGQSELSEMSQLIFNPPPSPVTERMSTITEMNNTTNLYSRYPDGQCDHCHRNMIGEQKFHLNEGGGRDAPPPTEVSSMMHDVDMYYPLNQTSDWTQKTICEECHSRISSSNGHINNGRLNLHDHNDMHVGNGHLHNGVVHKPIDELTDLNDDWMYDDEVDSANLDTHYGEERLFINSVGHHLFDPPPSPCTYYGEDRASSPTNTEQSSLAFGVLHSMDRHFAPPPSPTSQLL